MNLNEGSNSTHHKNITYPIKIYPERAKVENSQRNSQKGMLIGSQESVKCWRKKVAENVVLPLDDMWSNVRNQSDCDQYCFECGWRRCLLAHHRPALSGGMDFQSPKNMFQRPKFPEKIPEILQKERFSSNFRLRNLKIQSPKKRQFHTPSHSILPWDSLLHCLTLVYCCHVVVSWQLEVLSFTLSICSAGMEASPPSSRQGSKPSNAAGPVMTAARELDA